MSTTVLACLITGFLCACLGAGAMMIFLRTAPPEEPTAPVRLDMPRRPRITLVSGPGLPHHRGGLND